MRSDKSPKVALLSLIARGRSQVFANLGEEVILLSLHAAEYYGLDAVGARVWEIIAEPRTAKEILTVLLGEYDVDPERCERDLLALVRELAAEGFVEVTAETSVATGHLPLAAFPAPLVVHGGEEDTREGRDGKP